MPLWLRFTGTEKLEKVEQFVEREQLNLQATHDFKEIRFLVRYDKRGQEKGFIIAIKDIRQPHTDEYIFSYALQIADKVVQWYSLQGSYFGCPEQGKDVDKYTCGLIDNK